MSEQAPPAWGNDPLSTFLSDAQRNERVSPLKMPDVYALLQRVHGAFEMVREITEHGRDANLLPTQLLMRRAHSAWLAAVRLGLSAQTVEAYPLVRAVIENAWYALHLAKDPAPPARAKIWLGRDDDRDAQDRCAKEFSVGNVRKMHAALDAETEAVVHVLYERTIALGGHPNERGVFTTTVRTDIGFGAVYLTNNPAVIAMVLKTAVEAAVGVLKAFQLIFPERFAIMGMDGEIGKIVDVLNVVFEQYRR